MKLQLLKEPRELKPWVDVTATIAKFEYDPRWFKPSSCRLVIASCEECHQSRECKLREAELHSLCLPCSNRKNAQGQEGRKKRSEAMKLRELDPNYKHPTKGIGHTEEAKKKIRENRTPVVWTEEMRNHYREMYSGKGNPFYGRKHSLKTLTNRPKCTPETKAKLSAKLTRRTYTTETLAKMKLAGSRIRGKNNPSYGKIYHSKGAWVVCSRGRIWVRSSYEAAVVQYLDEQKYQWAFEPKAFSITYEYEGTQRSGTYRPDFYVEELSRYLEVKGYWRGDARAKFEAFKREYPSLVIEVWDKKTLKGKGIL